MIAMWTNEVSQCIPAGIWGWCTKVPRFLWLLWLIVGVDYGLNTSKLTWFINVYHGLSLSPLNLSFRCIQCIPNFWTYPYHIISYWLVVWNMNFMIFHILGMSWMSSSQLTFTPSFFQRGRLTTKQMWYFINVFLAIENGHCHWYLIYL